MKLIPLVIAITLGLSCVIGCKHKQDVVGTYGGSSSGPEAKLASAIYLDLKNGGQFVMGYGITGFDGNWKQDGDELVLTFTGGPAGPIPHVTVRAVVNSSGEIVFTPPTAKAPWTFTKSGP